MLENEPTIEGEDAPRDAVASAGASISRTDPAPPPLQFRLKTLLIATAAMCVIFALAGRLTGVGLAALVWFLMLIVAHMAATVTGTRTSAHAPTRSRAGGDRPSQVETCDRERDCAPTTRLGGNDHLGLILWIMTVVGAVIGCGVGTTLVALHNGGRLGWTALLLAALSSAGIGAFLSFLAGSFAQVAGRAWREASAANRRR